MISVKEASEIVFSHLGNFGTEIVPLSGSIHRILSEKIVADRPFPPFDRVMMDGIAINYSSWLKGIRIFQIEGSQFAGQKQICLQDENACLEVMTGAILPEGTDVVIPIEKITVLNGKAEVVIDEVLQFQHIHKQGFDKEKDEVLLTERNRISPSEVATLATVGKSKVVVRKLPKVAVISTGDELVEVDQIPERYQIRKSNVLALHASLVEEGINAEMFHLKDDKDSISIALTNILNSFDLVIMSGGVSKGKKDFVPEVLEELGVNKLFHRVNQRPGKPFWFGEYNSSAHIFALPGNPVSTFMCYYRYVKPWIYKSMGCNYEFEMAQIASDFEFKPELTYFLQVAVYAGECVISAGPIQGKGSGDLANLNISDGFLELPANKSIFKKGEKYPLIRYRF